MKEVAPSDVEIFSRVATVVAASGEVDLATAPALWSAIEAAVTDQCRRLVIDLSDVTFMDSSGLHVLAQAHQRMLHQHGGVEVRNASPQVHRNSDIVGIGHLIAVS